MEKIIWYIAWTLILVFLILGIYAEDTTIMIIALIILIILLIYNFISIVRHKKIYLLFSEWKSDYLDEKKNPVIFWLIMIVIMLLISGLIIAIGKII